MSSSSSSSSSSSAAPAFVRLRSAEKAVFILERSVAQTSGLIRTMLSGGHADGSKDIELPEITSAVLEKVIQYWHYKVKYQGSTKAIPEFHIPPELALNVLIAADYLEC